MKIQSLFSHVVTTGSQWSYLCPQNMFKVPEYQHCVSISHDVSDTNGLDLHGSHIDIREWLIKCTKTPSIQCGRVYAVSQHGDLLCSAADSWTQKLPSVWGWQHHVCIFIFRWTVWSLRLALPVGSSCMISCLFLVIYRVPSWLRYHA